MKVTVKCVAGVMVLASIATTQLASAEGDVNAGKWKAQTCLGCHGVPGYTNVYPTYHVPRLAGQHADYIVSALKAYRSGERDHRTMIAQSHRLDDQGILDVAAYFSSLDAAPPNPQATVPPELQQIVTTCSACHGNDGNSPLAIYPKIAGQFESYLYYSLLAYRRGERRNPIMMGIAATIEEADMKVLARYFASRPGLGSIEISITSE